MTNMDLNEYLDTTTDWIIEAVAFTNWNIQFVAVKQKKENSIIKESNKFAKQVYLLLEEIDKK